MLKQLINMADRTAITLSTLCVVHCSLLPIILIALPTLSSLAYISDERFHIGLLFAVIPISACAIAFGYAHHRSGLIVLIASVGIIILVLVAVFGHAVFGEIGEVIASVVGSVFVAFGHLKNLRCRKFEHQCSQASITASH